ncbi:MAG: sugar ABC transporter permease [Phototrophicales bacterium]|jgi:raffinose/stachyose/melibiose transport system permease protein|nr:MAG: sugar ABC transporter permease [Phototrophicales bacterium]
MSLANTRNLSEVKVDEATQIRREKRNNAIRKWLTVGIFLLPGMLVFIVFVLSPIAQTAVYSFYDWDGLGPLTNYQEFKNYERLFEHSAFIKSVQNTLVIMVLSLVIQLPIALMIALLVARGQLPGRKFFRAMLFIPYVFSEVITAIIWLYVLHPKDGLVNTVFTSLVPGYQNVAWTSDPNVILYSVFAVLVWKYFGFYMILYMASIQGVPKDLEEAARMDGAGEIGVLRYVTIPLIGPTIRLTIYLSVLGAIQQFVIVQILTTGGGINNSGSVIGTYLYKYGLQRFKLGYGSSIAVVLFLFTFVFSILYQRFVMSRDYQDD